MTNVFDCKDLWQLADWLEDISGKDVDHKALYQQLRQYYMAVCMESVYQGHPKWSVVDRDRVCPLYLYRNWAYARSANENANQLHRIATEIRESYCSVEASCLSLREAEAIMCHLDEKYAFSKKVIYGHLLIFLLPTQHRKEDSFCRTYQSKDGTTGADIYMLLPHKDCNATSQSIFLHELGHCLNLSLTGNPKVPPEDFAHAVRYLFPTLSEMRCEEVAEIFAHCFAMSILAESSFRQYDPFQTIPMKAKGLLRSYFEAKLQQL